MDLINLESSIFGDDTMYEVCMYVHTTQNIFGLVVTIEHLRGEIFALSHASINSFPHTLKYTYIGVEMQKNIMVKGHGFRKLWVYNRLCILFLR